MADTRKATVRVGIVTAAALLVAAVAIESLGLGPGPLTSTERLETHFDRVNGLLPGAPVMLSGVTIGSVTSTRFPADPAAPYVVVKLRVKRAALARLHADAQARIESMGLLGDKYVELTAGALTAPPLAPGAVLRSDNPIDYEALLQKPGAYDMVANILAISNSLRSLLDAVNRGNGIISELIRGSPSGAGRKTLTLEQVSLTLVNLDQVARHLDALLARIEGGQGLLGAAVADTSKQRRLLDNLSASVADARASTRRLNRLLERAEQAQGLLPRLVENRAYAARVMDNLDRSSEQLARSSKDLAEVMRKINDGQGTLGLLVNDPSLYRQTQSLLGGDSSGWGLSLLRGLYGITHPFRQGQQTPPAGAGAVPASAPPASALPAPPGNHSP